MPAAAALLGGIGLLPLAPDGRGTVSGYVVLLYGGPAPASVGVGSVAFGTSSVGLTSSASVGIGSVTPSAAGLGSVQGDTD